MGGPKSGGVKERRALRTFVTFMRAYNSMRARLEPHIRRHGLTASQFGALEALLHLGPMNLRTLGDKILSSKANMTMVVDNLEHKGLVRRQPEPSDRRQTIVHLTRVGRRLISAVFPQQAEAIAADFGRLTAAEQDTLARLCKKLGRD